MNGTQRTWWESLRHFGMLLSPAEVLRIENEFTPSDLSAYRLDQLRRELNRFEAEETQAGELVAWVLEHICGFDRTNQGKWLRGSNVPSEYSHILVTGESLRPRHLWCGPHAGLLPVFFDNSKRLGIGRGRKAISDCVQWLRAAHLPLALLTNGQQWRLIYAGLDFESATEWDTELWFEEGTVGPQLEALRILLQPALFDPERKEDPIPLVASIRASRRGQSDLSSELGERVREAVEGLVRAHGEVLSTTDLQASGADIYRAAVRIVMRLVVILFAESRDLLPRSNPVYHTAYSLQGLFEQLQRVFVRGKARLGQRFGAWPRILGLFRLLYEGSHHEALQIPAYGGDLFAPGKQDGDDPLQRALQVFETACFDGHMVPMPDTVVYQILEQLTRTRVRVRQGRSSTWTVLPVDFVDLSSEYIGILYEGLLDYELRTAPADDPILFLAVGNEPALPLSRLEDMDDRQIRDLLAQFKVTSGSGDDGEEGEDIESTEEETEIEEVEETVEEDLQETDVAEEESPAGSIEAARGRALVWTRRACLAGGIVRQPKGRATPEKQLQFERQLEAKARQLVRRVVLPGEWYLVRWGGTRKGAGTFYTRPQLAVPTVHRTLRPLAYQPDEEQPQERWQPRKPEEILALKVCDPGCGSGSFVVAALRFLTDALYASLHTHGRLEGEHDRTLVRLLGQSDDQQEERLSDEYIPSRVDDEQFEPRLKALLRRYVVEHCVYGVDLDPLAIELCRLALWIETMDRDLPFSFLDHKIKCGNSLIGCWFDQFAHYPAMAWSREGGDKGHSNGVHYQNGEQTRAIKEFKKEVVQPDLVEFLSQPSLFKKETLEEARSVHDKALETLAQLHEMPVQDTAERARIYRDQVIGSTAWKALKESFDLWCACWFWPGDQLEHAPLPSQFARPSEETRRIANQLRDSKRFFHWELEFPDVFSQTDSGFDAIVGNPPWETLQPSSMEFFSNIEPLYRAYGKQEALRVQNRLFGSEDIETQWIVYNDDFSATSCWVKYVSNPFGDPSMSKRSQDRFSLGRGKQNTELHQYWREIRSRNQGYADPDHPFRLQGGGKAYTYKMFLEHGHSLLRQGGRLGFIVPSGLYSDHGTCDLRELFLNHCRWEWLFGFENREKVFDIDSRFKFNPVIVEKGGTTKAIQATFMRRRLEDWEQAESFVIPYSREQVIQFSPRTQAILEIQSRRDLEILEKIYSNSVLLGDDGPDGWGVRYSQGDFNMTSDSKLFPPRPQWETQGYQPDEYSRWLKGEWKPRTERCPAPPEAKRVDIPEGVILSRDGSEWIQEDDVGGVALPFMQGVMLQQFDFSQKGWVSGTGLQAKWEPIGWSDKYLSPQFLMALQNCPPRSMKTLHRRVARNTDSRMMICALVSGFPAGDKAPILIASNLLKTVILAACLNSYTFDSILRNRCGSTNIDLSSLKVMPLPKDNSCGFLNVADHVLRLGAADWIFSPEWLHMRHMLNSKYTSVDRQEVENQWSLTELERLRLRSSLEAIISAAYGLEAVDIDYVLRGCDYPATAIRDKGINKVLAPKGFWRVDKGKDPELRHTVLTMVAFHDLQQKIVEYGGDRDKGIEAFCTQNDGEGWMLPETLRLADYGLGHDDRAKKPQPVASRLGPRFYDWQLEQDPEESWRECELHARNLLGEEGYRQLLEDIEAEKRGEKSTSRTPQTAKKQTKEKKTPKKRPSPPNITQQTELPLQVKRPEKKTSTSRSTESSSSIDEFHMDGVMMAFRQVARVNSVLDRLTLIKRAAYALGYGRVSSAMEDRMRNHLRAAILRKIIGTDGDQVWLETPSMADYEREDLVNTIYSAMRKGVSYEYEDVVRAVAEHLGFERLREEVAQPVRTAINSLIRQNILEKRVGKIRRLV